MNEITIQERPAVSEDIVITPRAAEEVRKIKADNKIPEAYGLRLGVKGGGCSGMSYVLAFDEKPRESDKVLEIEGLTVYVDPKSLFYLSGTTLDFNDGLNGRGFVFNNPNASRTCGCGHSFGV
ncbi:MAG TPA: iron-sulfur cluster assembly accessory protein [Bacteroidota bacterium]|nr:iron-sulfur cluster assembly accessory protein [Bacteroidota bacterium]